MARTLSDELTTVLFDRMGITPENNAFSNATYLKQQFGQLVEQAVNYGGIAERPKKGLFKSRQPADPSRYFSVEGQNIGRFVHNLETFLPSVATPTHTPPATSPQIPPAPSFAPTVEASVMVDPPNAVVAPEVVDAADLLAKLMKIEQQGLPAVMLGVHKGEFQEAGAALNNIDQLVTKAEEDFGRGTISGVEGSELKDKLVSVKTQLAVIAYEDKHTEGLLERYGGVNTAQLMDKHCPYGIIPNLGYSDHPADKFMNTSREMKAIIQEGGGVSRFHNVYKDVFPYSPTSAALAVTAVLQQETAFLNQASPLDVAPDKEAASQARIGVIQNWLAEENRLPPVVRERLETAIGSNRAALQGISNQQLFSQTELREAIDGLRQNQSSIDPASNSPSQNSRQERNGPCR